AELTRLLSRERSYQLGPAIAATLLDLGRRGHVHLQPVATTGWLGLQREDLALSRAQPPEDDSLQPHERLLLNFLLDKVAGGEPELRLSTLNRWFQRNQGETREFLEQWHKFLDQRSEELGFWKLPPDEQRQWTRARLLLLVVSVAVILLLLWLGHSLYWSEFVLWPLAVGGLAMAMLARRRSQYGADQKARWDAFKRFLLHFSRLDLAEVPAVALWEHYLVFATVLGVAEQVLKQMKEVLPKLQEQGRFDPVAHSALDRATWTLTSQRLAA